MARENGADLFGAGKRLVKHHAGAAWVGEDGINAGVFEGLDEEVATHGGGTEARGFGLRGAGDCFGR